MIRSKEIWVSKDNKYHVSYHSEGFNTEAEAINYRNEQIKNESLELIENIKIIEKLNSLYVLKEEDKYIYDLENKDKFYTYEEAVMHQYYMNNGNNNYRQFEILKYENNVIEIFIKEKLLGLVVMLARWENKKENYCHDTCIEYNTLKQWKTDVADTLDIQINWNELNLKKELVIEGNHSGFEFNWHEDSIIDEFYEDEDGILYRIDYEPYEEYKSIFEELFQNNLKQYEHDVAEYEKHELEQDIKNIDMEIEKYKSLLIDLLKSKQFKTKELELINNNLKAV